MGVVIGVDSGGTTTRALALSLDGERVAYVETGGGNPAHDAASGENLRDAIRRVAEGHEVVRIVAGVAGIDRPGDAERAAEAVGDLGCPATYVNDASVAHFSAFGDDPGIVSIQGTGSIIVATLEDGRVVRNGDLFHYARAGAVWVGIRTVQRLLTDPYADRDDALCRAVCDIWGVDSVASLRKALLSQRELSEADRSARYGAVARTATASAEAKGYVGSIVCGEAAKEIVFGLRLLGPLFASEEVAVTFVGSCGRSQPIQNYVRTFLSRVEKKRFVIVEPAMSPVEGAARMALRDVEGV